MTQASTFLPLSNQEIEALQDMAVQGWSIERMAAKLKRMPYEIRVGIEDYVSRARKVSTKIRLSAEQDFIVIALHNRGRKPSDIAWRLNMDCKVIINRMRKLYECELIADRIQHSETVPLTSSIYNEAGFVLEEHGHSEREIKLMTMDTRMNTANRYLHAKGLKQLGKKPEWLHA